MGKLRHVLVFIAFCKSQAADLILAGRFTLMYGWVEGRVMGGGVIVDSTRETARESMLSQCTYTVAVAA